MRRSGYTLIELVVVLALALALLTAAVATYTAFRRSISLDVQRASAMQNSRVALDRLSRELRQSAELVTNLDEGQVTAVLEFADGHTNDLTYKRYSISGTLLRLEVAEYYFASAPTVRVRWNAEDQFGNPPVRAVLSTQDVAEQVLTFSAAAPEAGMVTVVVTTGELPLLQYSARTTIALRN
jgi:prepilin-type N-terminal cleavage/methylation domain-containing protein